MAKITIILEDNKDDKTNPTISMVSKPPFPDDNGLTVAQFHAVMLASFFASLPRNGQELQAVNKYLFGD